jgi:hypothetical protein
LWEEMDCCESDHGGHGGHGDGERGEWCRDCCRESRWRGECVLETGRDDTSGGVALPVEGTIADQVFLSLLLLALDHVYPNL